MYCISIGERTAEGCIRSMAGVPFAEVRLDHLDPEEATTRHVAQIFSSRDGSKTIATCRLGRMDDRERGRLLEEAILAGASHVDIEVETEDSVKDHLVRLAKNRSCAVIMSYHNPTETPTTKALRGIIDLCQAADIIKIACWVNSQRDNARLLGLLDSDRPIVVVGLGPRGRSTRYLSQLLGSAISYTAQAQGKETAPGQVQEEQLRVFKALYECLSLP